MCTDSSIRVLLYTGGRQHVWIPRKIYTSTGSHSVFAEPRCLKERERAEGGDKHRRSGANLALSSTCSTRTRCHD
jgi:hypothetical protein